MLCVGCVSNSFNHEKKIPGLANFLYCQDTLCPSFGSNPRLISPWNQWNLRLDNPLGLGCFPWLVQGQFFCSAKSACFTCFMGFFSRCREWWELERKCVKLVKHIIQVLHVLQIKQVIHVKIYKKKYIIY